MIRWIWRLLFKGYNCDGCHRYIRRWRGRATPKVTMDYARLYCPTCAAARKEEISGQA